MLRGVPPQADKSETLYLPSVAGRCKGLSVCHHDYVVRAVTATRLAYVVSGLLVPSLDAPFQQQQHTLPVMPSPGTLTHKAPTILPGP
jgi:hypothetical protein